MCDTGVFADSCMIRLMLAFSHKARAHADVLAVLAVAASLRFAVFLAAVNHPQRFWSQDDREYLGVATHLHASYIAGSGHWFDVGLRRPPGYPLFVRLVFDVFGQHYAPLVATQLALSVVTVGLVYWLAGLILARRVAVLAALLLALDPASIIFANQMLSETLFALLLTLGLGMIMLGRQRAEPVLLVVAGLVLGVATLTRPVAEYLPLLLVAAFLVIGLAGRRPQSLALSAALLLGFAVPVGGWIVRNAERTGVPTLSTIDGHNMLDYRAVGALSESGEHPWDARTELARRLSARIHPGENAAEVSRAQMSLGLKVLAEQPVGAAKSWASGEFRLLGGPAKTETAMLLTGRQTVSGAPLRALVLVDQLLALLLVLAAGAGMLLVLARRVQHGSLWPLIATVVYLVVISGGPEAYSRFRVPVTPCLAILAAAALAAAAHAGPGRPFRSTGRERAPRSP